jgi:hypothetical protein
MKEIQRLPEQERERIFEFVLRSQKPGLGDAQAAGLFRRVLRQGRN